MAVRRLLLLSLLLALAATPAVGADSVIEKTLDVPRANAIPVQIAFQKSILVTVESQNDPQENDIKEALEKDPSDKTFVLLRFHYTNDDYFAHKVRLQAQLLEGDGTVLAEGGRKGTLDAKKKDDTFSFPIKVKTLDWPKAASLKVTATFLN